MKAATLSLVWKASALLALGVIVWACVLHQLTGHAAWFADSMFGKGGVHEMSGGDLHSLVVESRWEVHRLHTRYLSVIAALLAIISLLSIYYLKEIYRSPGSKQNDAKSAEPCGTDNDRAAPGRV